MWAVWAFSLCHHAHPPLTPSASPPPHSDLFYIITMLNIITATMLDYCMMGVVFARYAVFLSHPSAKWHVSRLADVNTPQLLLASPQVCRPAAQGQGHPLLVQRRLVPA